MNIFRRTTLAVAALIMFSLSVHNMAMAFSSEEEREAVKLDDNALFFPGLGNEKHSSVILLHGYRCIDDCLPDFTRYAQVLNKKGVDVYFFRYYDDSDMRALDSGTLDQGKAYVERFKSWTGKVSAAAQHIKSQKRSDGRVALIGFSQGGRLAIASAVNNPTIHALVVFYARLPRADELNGEIKALPPTLILHGSNDVVVPLADGEAIYAKTKSLGVAPHEIVVYPGEGHGFDFNDHSAAATDARKRVVEFIQDEMP